MAPKISKIPQICLQFNTDDEIQGGNLWILGYNYKIKGCKLFCYMLFLYCFILST